LGRPSSQRRHVAHVGNRRGDGGGDRAQQDRPASGLDQVAQVHPRVQAEQRPGEQQLGRHAGAREHRRVHDPGAANGDHDKEGEHE
jgi:hypothetical protein